MKLLNVRWCCLGWIAASLAARAAGSFEVILPAEFDAVIDTNSVLATNATVNYWLEGPVWVPSDGGYLVFSSMDSNNRLKKLVPPNTLTDFLVPAANTLFNGNTLDAQERLISCQAGTAGLRVVMVTNGVVNALVSTCNGAKFYSPNDVVVKSDGTIWFTDPGYNGYTGTPPSPGYAAGYYVYRFDPANGNATCTIVNTSFVRPNGLCFSPDESLLYIADSDNSRHHIRVFSVTSSNTLSGGAVFATLTNGIPDGIRCDINGRIWSSSSNGVCIYLPDGRKVGRIATPGTVANLCFGGPDWKTLYIVAQPRVYSLPLRVAGTPSIKRLQASAGPDGVTLSWPSPSTGFQLETSDPAAGSAWTAVPDAASVSNGLKQVTVSPTNPAAIYRLRKPGS
ncbi:MAG: SMP-30/gluconolactonase/LRE family protein [Verrucomicrobiota bacterium]